MGGHDFVHLVDENEWVIHLRRLQTVNQLARHRAYVRATVSLDLRHVVSAADAELVVLATECARDAFGDGGFASAWRADEAENLAGNVSLQFADGDEFEDTVLDVLAV